MIIGTNWKDRSRRIMTIINPWDPCRDFIDAEADMGVSWNGSTIKTMAFNTKMVIIWGSPILGQHVVGIIGWFPTFHAPSGGSMLQPSLELGYVWGATVRGNLVHTEQADMSYVHWYFQVPVLAAQRRLERLSCYCFRRFLYVFILYLDMLLETILQKINGNIKSLNT